MFSRYIAPLILIILVTFYSCKKSSGKPTPVTPPSIVGKWLAGKQEKMIHDTTGKLVYDTLYAATNPAEYYIFNANGNLYDAYIDIYNQPDTTTYTWHITNKTLYINNDFEISNIIQLSAHNLELDYRLTGLGNVFLVNGLDPTKTYTQDLYQYYSR